MARAQRITVDTIRQLAGLVGLRPREADLDGMARGLDGMLAAIERCNELGLDQHEPAVTLTLTGGATDAER